MIDEGCEVSGVDASPGTIAFRANFPAAPAACQPVESSDFFHHTFDAVISWGLMFLLPGDTQVRLIATVGSLVRPGGLSLFTAPTQTRGRTI